MRNKKIYFFVGTTAELIKLAPIIREFKKRRVLFKFIISGQTQINFKDLVEYTGKIRVDIAFKEKGKKSSIFLFMLWMIRTFVTAIYSLRNEFWGLNKENSYFIIHGDTVSSLIGALVASIYGLKLVHVESGLRSFNFLEPFPEEICRYLIIHLANIRFAPTKWALNNLKNLHGTNISTGQNTLIETCQWALGTKGIPTIVKRYKKYYIQTMHRQEHVLFKKGWTINTIKHVIRNAPDNLYCILVTHHLTTNFFGSGKPQGRIWRRVVIQPRLPYVDFMKLMRNAEFIATDGCTNQEEAYYMGLPLLALRNVTERIEGLGGNVIISKDNKNIIKKFLKNYKLYKRRAVHFRGQPSKIIVDYLLKN